MTLISFILGKALYVIGYLAIAFVMFHLFRFLLYAITKEKEAIDPNKNSLGLFGNLIIALLWPALFLVAPIIIFCWLCIWSCKHINIKK